MLVVVTYVLHWFLLISLCSLCPRWRMFFGFGWAALCSLWLADKHILHYGSEKILHPFGEILRFDQSEATDLSFPFPADHGQFIPRLDVGFLSQIFRQYHLAPFIDADQRFDFTATGTLTTPCQTSNFFVHWNSSCVLDLSQRKTGQKVSLFTHCRLSSWVSHKIWLIRIYWLI